MIINETYSKLYWHREVINTRLCGYFIAARNPWKIYKGRLDNAFFALTGLDDFFSKAK